MILYSLLSALPILVLLVLSLTRGVKTGIYAGFLVTTILFFVWGSELLTFFASIFAALVDTIGILMIIFGAIFLYHIMEQKGFIEGIKSSLAAIHPDKTFRFFFLAFFLTAFFESVAGFGTPGAIVPLLLISIGFSPVLSIATVLLIDGFFAMSGAVGTPVIAGLETPLGLNPQEVQSIYLSAAAMIFAGGLPVVFLIGRFLKKEGSANTSFGWMLYLAIMIPYLILSSFLLELTGLISAIVMALISYIFFFKNRNFDWKPWLPYALLVILLLLPKMFPGFGNLLTYKISFSNIFGTTVNSALQPFRSPLIPFLAAALFAVYRSGSYQVDLKPVFSKTFTVFLVLFPSLGITQLMLNSGNETPSMVNLLADLFVKSGDFYPLFSPMIGILGAFITGSTTVSNIIFGPVQESAATNLGLSSTVVLALQLAGASLGNAICLFNIIAAAAVAGIGNYSDVLKKNLLPVIIASVFCTLVAWLMFRLI
jgi:lactate permease